MTLDFVAATYHAPEAALLERLALEVGTDPRQTLRQLAQRERQPMIDYTQRVQRAIAALVPAARTNDAERESNGLGKIADEFLAAVLIYGYPALGLTILLGSIGLPAPDGFATSVSAPGGYWSAGGRGRCSSRAPSCRI
jgi:hypothetical protein